MDAPGLPGDPAGPPPAPEQPGNPAGPPVPPSAGYGPPGYGPPGAPPPGYPPPGPGAPGYPTPGYAPPGYGAPGYPPPGPGAPGYPTPGYAPPGYGAPGYPTPGYAPPGYGAPGYPPPGYGPPSSGPYGPPQPGWAPHPGWAPYGYGQPPVPVGFGRFRPQGAGELLDAAFSLYRANVRLIILIAALVEIPYALIALGLHATVYRALHLNDLLRVTPDGQLDTSPFTQDAQVGQLLVFAGVTLGLALLQQFVVRPLGTAATARAVSDRYLERDTSVKAAYRASLHRLVTLTGVALILLAVAVVPVLAAIAIAVVVSPLLLFLTLPVVFLFVVVALVSFTFTPQVVMLEGKHAVAALRRSRQLMAGSFWRVLGYLILLLLLSVIVGGILGAAIGAMGSGLGSDGQQLLVDLANALVAVLVAPITYITLTLLYYDLRIRREAFDVEMLARAL